MQKKVFFSILLLFCLLAVLYFFKTTQTQKVEKPNGPNVILITIDTVNRNHLDTYSGKSTITPNLDQLAKESYRMDNYYTIFPVTIHSFYTLFSGTNDVFMIDAMSKRYPSENRNREWLPKILQNNGYKTAAFITNPTLGIVGKNVFSYGFEDYSYTNTSAPGVFSGDIFRFEYQNGKITTDKSLAWLEKHPNDKIFLWTHYNITHQPYNPPQKFLCMVDKSCSIAKYKELLADSSSVMKTALPSCTGQVTAERITNAETLYDAELLATDVEVGKILDKLKKLHLYDKSIIIVTADHGEGFDHDIYEHGKSLYNSSILIPLFIKLPNEKKQTIVHSLADNTDFTPTVLDLLGIAYQKSRFSGQSFADKIDGHIGKKPSKPYSYSLTPTNETHRFEVTDGKYTYIYSFYNQALYEEKSYCLYKGYQRELYNIEKDPNQTTNIDAQNPKVAALLKSELEKEMEKRITDESKESVASESGDLIKNLGY